MLWVYVISLAQLSAKGLDQIFLVSDRERKNFQVS